MAGDRSTGSNITKNKLAIVFPGIGYTKDRPLLYYAGKAAAAHGYRLLHVDFSGIDWSKEKLKDHAFLLHVLDKCLQITERALADEGDLSGQDILFLSKSIGTVVASAYARKKGLHVKQVCFSPLEMIRDFIEEGSGILFYGDNDPLADHTAIQKLGSDKKLELHRIEGGNHSLETGNIHRDIENLDRIIKRLEDAVTDSSLYRISVRTRDGGQKALADYRGQVLLIVNTATGCGFTPQYEALERIYRTYGKDGFAVLDFPCNQFDRQAPGSASEIHNFCTARYDISFEQFAKICVNGPDAIELYTYLKAKQGFHGFGEGRDAEYLRKKLATENPDFEETTDIKWNFTKFLISREGTVLARFEPTEPLSEVEKAVRSAL